MVILAHLVPFLRTHSGLSVLGRGNISLLLAKAIGVRLRGLGGGHGKTVGMMTYIRAVEGVLMMVSMVLSLAQCLGCKGLLGRRGNMQRRVHGAQGSSGSAGGIGWIRSIGVLGSGLLKSTEVR